MTEDGMEGEALGPFRASAIRAPFRIGGRELYEGAASIS